MVLDREGLCRLAVPQTRHSVSHLSDEGFSMTTNRCVFIVSTLGLMIASIFLGITFQRRVGDGWEQTATEWKTSATAWEQAANNWRVASGGWERRYNEIRAINSMNEDTVRGCISLKTSVTSGATTDVVQSPENDVTTPRGIGIYSGSDMNMGDDRHLLIASCYILGPDGAWQPLKQGAK